MDKTVPAGAAILLSFVYKTETDRDPPACYEVIYGHNETKLKAKITSMTLDEIEAAQAGWSKRFGSSATGAAQFMKNTLDAPKTLRDLEGEMGLTGKERFTPDLQDRMAYHLLKRRGYLEFVAGKINAAAFGKRLAQEWASFPVLADTKGAKRQVKRGQSYYAGDGLNKALTTPEQVEGILSQVLAAATLSPAPVPAVAFPSKGAKDNEVVAQVQRRLKELGYTEIGNVDGDFGDMTETAILVFRHDNGLPPPPVIDEALLVAMAKAAPRKLPEARTEATPADVREKVPEARASWWSKVVAFWGLIGTGVLSVMNFIISNFADAKATVKPIADLFGAVPAWTWGLLVGAGLLTIYIKSKSSEQKSVVAYQDGARR